MIPTLAQLGQRFWMPESASTYSGKTDFLFYLIYWIAVGAFVVVVSLMVFFVIRYRHRPGHSAQPTPSHSTALELTWTAIPAIALLAIFYTGFRGFLDIATPPDYAYEITVNAYKWGWQFSYPNGASSPDLHIPRDRPVKVILQSQDVIHSLFIPAFRFKKDAVPGRYNTGWFQATQRPPVREDGQAYFDIFCAEYCGTKHSLMRAKLFVHEDTEFARWLEDAANWVQRTPPVEAGAKLFQTKGCAQCHQIEQQGQYPRLRNLFGHERAFRDGSRAVADENYIRQSILTPGAKIVAGFDNVMPPYQGRMKDMEITALIEWMKSLSDKGPAPLKAFPATQPAGAGATGGGPAGQSGAATQPSGGGGHGANQ